MLCLTPTQKSALHKPKATTSCQIARFWWFNVGRCFAILGVKSEMKLEERLHELRKKEGLTQAQVAETIGVSRQAVSKWESGTASPSLDNLNSLSILYGVSIDRVVGKEELAGAEPLEEASLEEEPPLDADASLDNLPPLPTPSSRCCRRKENPLTKKHWLLFSAGILAALLAVTIVVILIVSKFSLKDDKVALDDLNGGEITVASSDSFDFEF